MTCSFFYYFGLATCTYLVARVLLWTARTFVLKGGILSRVAPRGADNWAIITGCTGGIGEGFAQELAARKLNVVLISRSMDKLNKQASTIESKFNVKTKCVAIDFGAEESAAYTKKLKDTVDSIAQNNGNVSVLVNNVGVNYEEMPNKFLEITQKEQDQMVKINIEATMNVTRVVLARMVEQKKGFVINLGSYTAAMPVPMLSVYNGTKAFVESWSTALTAEYRSSGIEVVAISPMYVVSAMSGFRKPSLFVASQRRMAADTIDQSGTLLTPAQWSPFFSHSILIFLQSLLPQRLLLGQQQNAMKGVRSRIIKRKERQTTGGKRD